MSSQGDNVLALFVGDALLLNGGPQNVENVIGVLFCCSEHIVQCLQAEQNHVDIPVDTFKDGTDSKITIGQADASKQNDTSVYC